MCKPRAAYRAKLPMHSEAIISSTKISQVCRLIKCARLTDDLSLREDMIGLMTVAVGRAAKSRSSDNCRLRRASVLHSQDCRAAWTASGNYSIYSSSVRSSYLSTWPIKPMACKFHRRRIASRTTRRFSLVTAPYQVNGQIVGTLGVIPIGVRSCDLSSVNGETSVFGFAAGDGGWCRLAVPTMAGAPFVELGTQDDQR